MKIIGVIVALLYISTLAYAEEQSKKTDINTIVQVLADSEIQEMNDDLKTWVEPEQVKEFSQAELTDDDIKALYEKFINTLVMPPDPDTYKEYGIENGDEKLVEVEKLGRTINSMIVALPMDNLEKYGYLLKAMRDVLYLDTKHIPLAIKHDNSRDYYWYSLHNSWADEAERLYTEMFEVNYDKIEDHLFKDLKEQEGKSDAEIHQAIGYALLKTDNKWERATVRFKKALELDPSLYFSWYNLGLIYIDTEEGNNYFKKAIEVKPDFAPPYYWLAYTYCRMRKDKDAIPVFEKYLEVAEGDQNEIGRISVAEKVLKDLYSGKEGENISKLRRPFDNGVSKE